MSYSFHNLLPRKLPPPALRGPYVSTLYYFIIFYHHMSYLGMGPKIVSPTIGWFTFQYMTACDHHFHNDAKSPSTCCWPNSKRTVPLPRLQPKFTLKPIVELVGSLPVAGPMVVPAAPEFSTDLGHVHMAQDSGQTVIQKGSSTVAFKLTLQIYRQISSKTKPWNRLAMMAPSD